MPPRIALLHPRGDGIASRQAGQHRLGVLPARNVERLKRFVREVERVPNLDVAVVGRRREEHVRYLCAGSARTHGGGDASLRALGVAHLHEAAEPALQRRHVGVALRQRLDWKSWGPSGAVARHRG